MKAIAQRREAATPEGLVGKVLCHDVRDAAGKIAVDASRFRAAGEVLILSGLRENVIPAGRSTHLYTIFWKA